MRQSIQKSVMIVVCLVVSFRIAYAETHPSLNTVVQRMVAHNLWQSAYVTEYTAVRTLRGDNSRFNLAATLVVETAFQRPQGIRSKVIRYDGSELIREFVLDSFLEAEQDDRSAFAGMVSEITPDNYEFSWIGQESCDSRPCYHLAITPKRTDKSLLRGEIWLDGEDCAILRVHGTPVQTAFWMTGTEIDRRYTSLDGIWLPKVFELRSDSLITGHSDFSIHYKYTTIRTGN
jgi:hypothetical protein